MTPKMISSAIADTCTITDIIQVNLGFQDFCGGERSSERERGEKEAGCVGRRGVGLPTPSRSDQCADTCPHQA